MDAAERVLELVQKGVHYARCLERVRGALTDVGPLQQAITDLGELEPELAPELLPALDHLQAIVEALQSAAEFCNVRYDLVVNPTEGEPS